MRALVSSLFGLLLLLLVGIVTAQTPTLMISPDVVPIGTAFNVTGSGLKPNTTYILAIIDAESDESVYETDTTSNSTGRIALNLNTNTETDQPGDYVIELREADEVVASLDFELETAETVVPTIEPDLTNTGDGNLNVFPSEGVSGTGFEILITGLEAGQSAEVTIEGPDGSEVYSTTRTVADDGTVDVKIFTESSDGPGTYTVTARSGDSVLETSFVLNALTGQDGTLTVTPQTGNDRPSYLINIEGVKPFTDLAVTIQAPDSTEPLFESHVRSGFDGKAIVEFNVQAGTQAGTYNIVVLDREAEVATGSLTLDETALALVGGPVLRISPQEADAGTLRLITVSGLISGETVTIEIAQGRDVISTEDKTVDVNGTVAVGLRAIGDDSPGDYTIRILRGETAVATSTLTIIGEVVEELTPTPTASEVTLTIDPPAGEVGSSYDVRIEGLTAGETIAVDVTFDGESVYAVDKTADSDGVVTLRLSTGPSDPTGTYTVTALLADDPIASADLEVTDGAQPEATNEPEATVEPEATLEVAEPTEVIVSVEPASGPQGTQHIIRVVGLAPNAEFSIDLVTQDRVVFSSEKTSSAQGVIEFAIETEEGDTPGDYTVNVHQGGLAFGSASLTIEDGAGSTATPTPDATVEPEATQEATAEPSGDVSIAIDPASGPRGTTHQVIVTGLEPDETVLYEVSLDGETVVENEVVASEEGIAVFELVSEESDPLGAYIVDILRDGTVVASGELTIDEGALEETPTPEATDEPDTTATPEGEASVEISPESGVPGTSHEVVITGLPADESVVIEVEFEGDVVYTVDKRANSEGRVTMTLATAEDDDLGVYTVNVVVDDETIVSGDLEVIDSEDNTGPEGQTDENTGPEGQTDETDETDETDVETAVPLVPGSLLLDVEDTLEDGELEYTFDGDEGDSIIATLSSETFDSYLSLRGPDGEELSYNDDFNGFDSQIGPLTLPESGEYTLVVSSYTTYEELPTGGDFILQVYSVILDEITADSPQTLTFSPEAQMYYFTFEGAVGDVVDITVASDDDVDTVLTLIDASGTTITSDDDGGSGFNPEIYQYALSTAGTYTIVVSTDDTTGTAELTFQQEGAAALDEGSQDVRLTAKLYSRALTYEAQEGETVLLNVSVTAGEPIDVTITAYQGELQLMTYTTTHVPEGTVLGFEVPESGQVEIFVTGTNTGAVTVELGIDQ